MEAGLTHHSHVKDDEEEDEEEYVLIDLDAVSEQVEIPPNAPYVLSVEVPSPLVYVILLLTSKFNIFVKIKEAAPVVHEETGPSEANLFSGAYIIDPNQAPVKQVKPVARLQKILKFRVLLDNDVQDTSVELIPHGKYGKVVTKDCGNVFILSLSRLLGTNWKRDIREIQNHGNVKSNNTMIGYFIGNKIQDPEINMVKFQYSLKQPATRNDCSRCCLQKLNNSKHRCLVQVVVPYMQRFDLQHSILLRNLSLGKLSVALLLLPYNAGVPRYLSFSLICLTRSMFVMDSLNISLNRCSKNDFRF
ncbi:hypothetical protein RCOM_1125920 [Ricinus communis]|uniref:Uncharacterized protein n=1 Tax=Ricinus communis TaxID=3988 RepID=B9SRF3_RICCO|nr:hypothetical protein RCOM_1125920 [Ricinus communis]